MATLLRRRNDACGDSALAGAGDRRSGVWQSMQQDGVRWRIAGLILGLTLFLAACAHNHRSSDAPGTEDEEINSRPINYKPDILAAMHAYLNDPTGIRDAGISDPSLKAVGGAKRYVVCVRFNAKMRFDAKKNSTDYAGVKETAAVFVAGRFDHFAETAHELCADATYTPFPELEKLPR